LRCTFEELLFQLGLGNLDLNGLVNLLGMSLLVVGIVFDGGGEQGVDEGSLSQPGFASNLYLSINYCSSVYQLHGKGVP
jgi:hypothetical protein